MVKESKYIGLFYDAATEIIKTIKVSDLKNKRLSITF